MKLRKGRTCALSLVSWSSLCTYRLSQPSVATVCSLFSLKKKIFLFSKFLLFYYLKKKTVAIITMLLTTMSILLILWKEKGFLHTINVSLFCIFSVSLFVCLFCLFPNYCKEEAQYWYSGAEDPRDTRQTFSLSSELKTLAIAQTTPTPVGLREMCLDQFNCAISVNLGDHSQKQARMCKCATCFYLDIKQCSTIY